MFREGTDAVAARRSPERTVGPSRGADPRRGPDGSHCDDAAPEIQHAKPNGTSTAAPQAPGVRPSI